jgi:hypothetical protein
MNEVKTIERPIKQVARSNKPLAAHLMRSAGKRIQTSNKQTNAKQEANYKAARWASRGMPQVLMALMRHEKIETTMRYYVGRNANTVADAVWAVVEKSQEGTVLDTITNAGAKKKGPRLTQPLALTIFSQARATGIEPATTGSTVRYSNQLSYAPTLMERGNYTMLFLARKKGQKAGS